MTKQALTPLHIFKPGRHTAMGGQRLEFSENDLQATAAAYDPKVHEAPIVVGHPRLDAPAYGWISAVRFSDEEADAGLFALPAQVNPDFADMVAAGAFKKISASFFHPDAPSNPVKGVYYLRHVGFLGAQPPAVKGLRTPSFAADEEGVITFSEWDDVDNAGLWRSLREWLIGKFGMDEADKVVPGWTVKNLEQSAQDEVREAQAEGDTGAAPAPSFSDPNPKENSVTEEEARRLRAENEAQAQRIRQMEADSQAANAAKQHQQNVAFADSLAGRLRPADREMVIATLDHLNQQPAVVEFGEGDAKKPLADSLKAFLSELPELVNFSETATGARAATVAAASLDFAAPGGYQVDPQSVALHQKALAYQKANSCSFAEAAVAVQQG